MVAKDGDDEGVYSFCPPKDWIGFFLFFKKKDFSYFMLNKISSIVPLKKRERNKKKEGRLHNCECGLFDSIITLFSSKAQWFSSASVRCGQVQLIRLVEK